MRLLQSAPSYNLSFSLSPFLGSLLISRDRTLTHWVFFVFGINYLLWLPYRELVKLPFTWAISFLRDNGPYACCLHPRSAFCAEPSIRLPAGHLAGSSKVLKSDIYEILVTFLFYFTFIFFPKVLPLCRLCLYALCSFWPMSFFFFCEEFLLAYLESQVFWLQTPSIFVCLKKCYSFTFER